MGYLRVNQVIYSGDKYHFESEIFDKNIVLIEGDNGTGKTTLCNLIYYAFGGRVEEFRKDSEKKKHKEVTSDTNNYVEIYISVSVGNYQLRRYLNDNDVTLTEYDELIDPENGNITFSTDKYAQNTSILPIYRRENTPYTFSDWLLKELGISVVEIYQGYSTFKINSTDLFRLMYHDQQPDPEYIYKKIDIKQNHVSDSEILRKAIFELLIGKSFSEYYDSIVDAKTKDKDKNVAKSLVNEYSLLADKIRGDGELKNINFLQNEQRANDLQLEKLQAAREAFKKNRNCRVSVEPNIEHLKNQIIEIELELGDIKEILLSLYNERYKLVTIQNETISEINQISKIIHTHDQLNLFSGDTCPYCLVKVDRGHGKCVCGSDINEEQYERFFYTSQEYKEILKSKTKTLATIKLAISDCNLDIQQEKGKSKELSAKLPSLKSGLRKNLEKIDDEIDIDSLNDIDDKILDIREDSGKLEQLIEIEGKLQKLQKDFEAKRSKAQDAELKRKELESKTKREVSTKVSAFSAIYNELMTDTLSDCRSARISLDDYLPLINDGEYREASSLVSMRMMYYVALMNMSLKYDDVAFPKFLIVDTPETAGIELDNLIKCINKLEALDDYQKNYQVILATGLNKYPQTLKTNRVLFLPNKANALLKKYN